MTVRKYSDYPRLREPNSVDYFFRFMKVLSSQIIPVTIDFKGY